MAQYRYEIESIHYLNEFLRLNFINDWILSYINIIHNPGLKSVYITNCTKMGGCVDKIAGLFHDLGIGVCDIQRHQLIINEDDFFKFYTLIKLQGGTYNANR